MIKSDFPFTDIQLNNILAEMKRYSGADIGLVCDCMDFQIFLASQLEVVYLNAKTNSINNLLKEIEENE